jgi:predicted nucleotidyltransferase
MKARREQAMLKVPASEFQRNIGKYQDLALTQPIAVTRNGRVKTILISADRYAALAGPPSKEEIAKRLAPHIERLKKEGVGALYLFGSVARGEAGPDSDIDFFVDKGREKFSLLDLVKVQRLLEDALEHEVDATTRESLNPMLRSEIEASAIRIF